MHVPEARINALYTLDRNTCIRSTLTFHTFMYLHKIEIPVSEIRVHTIMYIQDRNACRRAAEARINVSIYNTTRQKYPYYKEIPLNIKHYIETRPHTKNYEKKIKEIKTYSEVAHLWNTLNKKYILFFNRNI